MILACADLHRHIHGPYLSRPATARRGKWSRKILNASDEPSSEVVFNSTAQNAECRVIIGKQSNSIPREPRARGEGMHEGQELLVVI